MKIVSAGDMFLSVIYLIEMYSSWCNKPCRRYSNMIFNNECITQLKSNIYCKIQKNVNIWGRGTVYTLKLLFKLLLNCKNSL